MQYCINIIKSNQIKSNQIKSGIIYFKQYFLKIFLIALLSFIALFSISCNNTYAPFGYDIPTTSGELVTAGSSYNYYSGDNFTRAKLEVSPETAKNIAEAEVIFPSIYIPAGVNRHYDKISVEAPYSTIKDAPFYQYGDYYDTGAVYNARVDNGNVKSYIKFIMLYQHMSVDRVTAEYVVAMTTNGMSIRATYTAILSYSGPIY